MNKRNYNVVVYGASGFTGKLICDYIYSHPEFQSLDWAVAGRNEEKLQPLAKKYNVDYIVADSFNKDQLDTLCQSTNVVITTVGPYDIYGEILIASCIDSSTHYLDLTGEYNFVKRIHRQYSKAALDANIILMHCCGFDSLPPDLCTFLCANEINSAEVDFTYNIKTKGKISGGTWASVLNISSNPSKGIRGAIGKSKKHTSKKIISYSKRHKKWKILFPTIDTYISLKTVSSIFPSIKEKSFTSYLIVPSYLAAVSLLFGVGAISILSRFKFIKRLLLKIKPSGSGPSKEERESHWFKSEVVASTENKVVAASISGGDPGYSETAKFISELSLCIIKDYSNLSSKSGILTPMECAGSIIIERLKKRGLEISIEKEG